MRGKQQNEKDQRSFEENWRFPRNVSYKDGHNKDRSDKDLTEAEEIQKRCQEYIEDLYKKGGLYDPDNHNGVVTYIEPHILEYEVKWPLGSITIDKDRKGDGISASLFQILRVDAFRVLHSICQQIWKTQQQPLDWKKPIFISTTNHGNAKEWSNYHSVVFISYASKVMLKGLKSSLEKHMS